MLYQKMDKKLQINLKMTFFSNNLTMKPHLKTEKKNHAVKYLMSMKEMQAMLYSMKGLCMRSEY